VPEDIVGRILRLPGYGVFQSDFDEVTSTALLHVRQVAPPLYTYGGCGIEVGDAHEVHERKVRDLPWGAWKVSLVLKVHRVRCRRCGVKTERLGFLEGKHPYTRRFAAAVARDYEDMAVSRVAAKWGLAPQTARRIDKRALAEWQRNRKRRPLRQMGVGSLNARPL
jgi:transposase